MKWQTKNNWKEIAWLLSKERTTEQERSDRQAALEEEDRDIYRILDQVKLDCDYREAMEIKEEVLQTVYHKAFGQTEQIRPSRRPPLHLWLCTVAACVAFLLALSYLGFRSTEAGEPEKQIVFTSPYGVSNVLLPDSSLVTLNAGSRLCYFTGYARKTRRVELEGEACFQIMADPDKPFIVSTSSIDVKVLGTVFNLSAYPEDEEITTSLLRGAVELNDRTKGGRTYRLTPNQEAVYRKTTRNMQLQPFEAEYAISWTEGKLIFRKKPFAVICKRLEKKFNCRIEVKNERLRQKSFTGKFVNDESLPQILDIIRVNVPFDYRINGNQVIIY